MGQHGLVPLGGGPGQILHQFVDNELEYLVLLEGGCGHHLHHQKVHL